MRGHASKRHIKKLHIQTDSPLLRRENVVIHTHGHTIIIYCYLQRCITTVRNYNNFAARASDWKASGSWSFSSWIENIRYSLNFSVWTSVNKVTASNCINCYQSARFYADLFLLFFVNARIATSSGWESLFCTIGYKSEPSRLSFKCDSDCWSIPEDEERENGILSSWCMRINCVNLTKS